MAKATLRAGARGLVVFLLIALGSACRQSGPALTEDLHQTVVLTVERAPAWVGPGAHVEIRDENDAVLLESDLSNGPPIMVDVDAPTSVRRLAVALTADGHEAHGVADVHEGYAACDLR